MIIYDYVLYDYNNIILLAIDHWSLYDHDHGCDDSNNDYLENQFVTFNIQKV